MIDIIKNITENSFRSRDCKINLQIFKKSLEFGEEECYKAAATGGPPALSASPPETVAASG